VIRDQSGDQLLANEKGWNTYSRVEAPRCRTAVDWWNDNQRFWADVRDVWDEVFATRMPLKLNMKVEDKILFMRLFALGDELSGENYDAVISKQKIRETIQLHLSEEGDIRIASN